MSTARIVEDCPHAALERLSGCDQDKALVQHALLERDALLRELHVFKQNHSTAALDLIADAIRRMERGLQFLKQYADQEGQKDHG